MNKSTFYTSLLIVFLSVFFLLISFLVFLYPRNREFLNRKFKVGGMIISLVGVMSLTYCTKPMCYDPVEEIPENTISINGYGNDTITLDSNSSNILTGIIENRTATEFSYSICFNDSIVQSGNIQAEDGVYDNYTEQFSILMNDSLPPAYYDLKLLVGSVTKRSYILAII